MSPVRIRPPRPLLTPPEERTFPADGESSSGSFSESGSGRVERGADVAMLTVGEVAALLRVCTATVYKLCAVGEIPSLRILNSIRVSPQDLAEFIRRRRP